MMMIRGREADDNDRDDDNDDDREITMTGEEIMTTIIDQIISYN